jgi:hypothetical protein
MTYIDEAVSRYKDQKAKADEVKEQERLTRLRTSHTWATFVSGLFAEVTAHAQTINAAIREIRGDTWVPITVQMAGTVLLITTPEVVRRVWFYEETHLFRIEDEYVAGKYPDVALPRELDGHYYVEKTTDAGGFDVYLQTFKTSSKVENPAQAIMERMMLWYLK